MADVDDLAGELRAPEGDPAGAIVLLHGRGTSEQDMLPLLDVFDPFQFYLAGALLARHPRAELWYGRPEAEELDPALDAEMAERAVLTMTPEQLLAIAPLRMAELGIATGSSG